MVDFRGRPGRLHHGRSVSLFHPKPVIPSASDPPENHVPAQHWTRTPRTMRGLSSRRNDLSTRSRMPPSPSRGVPVHPLSLMAVEKRRAIEQQHSAWQHHARAPSSCYSFPGWRGAQTERQSHTRAERLPALSINSSPNANTLTADGSDQMYRLRPLETTNEHRRASLVPRRCDPENAEPPPPTDNRSGTALAPYIASIKSSRSVQMVTWECPPVPSAGSPSRGRRTLESLPGSSSPPRLLLFLFPLRHCSLPPPRRCCSRTPQLR